jgi:DNA replication protein DnaC
MKPIQDVLNAPAPEGSLRWLSQHPEAIAQREAELGMVKRDKRSEAAGSCQYNICGGAGFTRYDVPVGHPLFGKAVQCQCSKDKAMQTEQQRIEEYRQQLSATERTWTLKNWPGTDKDALAAAKDAVQNPYGLRLFIGAYGIGKSGLLAAIVNSALEHRLKASYLIVNAMLNKLRGAYNLGVGEFEKALDEICTVRVLALDEMSAYKPSEWADQTLRTIFDERYRHWDERLTVIGSNEMIEHDAIRSRLNDQERSKIIHVQGKDLRPVVKDLVDAMRSETDEEWLLDEADVLAKEFDDNYIGVRA